MLQNRNHSQKEAASVLALKLIAFVAADPHKLAVIQGATGLDMADFKNRLGDTAFQIMFMDFALQDQSLVLEFAASENLPPEAVLRAHAALSGPMEA